MFYLDNIYWNTGQNLFVEHTLCCQGSLLSSRHQYRIDRLLYSQNLYSNFCHQRMINLLNLLVNNFINIHSTNTYGVSTMSDNVLGNRDMAVNKHSTFTTI